MHVNVASLSINSRAIRAIVVFILGANSIVHTTLCANVNASVQNTLNVVSIPNTNAIVHIALHTNVSAGVQTALHVVSIPNTNAIIRIALRVQTVPHINVASLCVNACTLVATAFSFMIMDLLVVEIGPVRTHQLTQECIAELHAALTLMPGIVLDMPWVPMIHLLHLSELIVKVLIDLLNLTLLSLHTPVLLLNLPKSKIVAVLLHLPKMSKLSILSQLKILINPMALRL